MPLEALRRLVIPDIESNRKQLVVLPGNRMTGTRVIEGDGDNDDTDEWVGVCVLIFAVMVMMLVRMMEC